MIFNINSTRGQTRVLTCVARVTWLVTINAPTGLDLSVILVGLYTKMGPPPTHLFFILYFLQRHTHSDPQEYRTSSLKYIFKRDRPDKLLGQSRPLRLWCYIYPSPSVGQHIARGSAWW